VDHLDQVGVAGLLAFVVVVASMDGVDSAGGHRVIGLLGCRVEHRSRLLVVGSLHPWNPVRCLGESGDGLDSPDERTRRGGVISSFGKSSQPDV
jgi:hypothetical protein